MNAHAKSAGLIVLAAGAVAVGQPSFTGLGTLLGGTGSGARAVSADGSAVTGHASIVSGATHAFHWTASSGMQDLGTLLSGGDSWGYGISADGSTITGSSDSRAFRWTAQTGMNEVGPMPGHPELVGTAINADGSVIVGFTGSLAPRLAFRWSAITGIEDLGFFPGGSDSFAYAVSADGSVVAGHGILAGQGARAFRWTRGTGMQELAGLPGSTLSTVSGISADGGVIVGHLNSGGIWLPVMWTSAGAFDLGLPSGAIHSNVLSASANASRITGFFQLPSGQRAFLWTAATGILDLNAYLVSLGVNLSGWTLTTAQSISADGSTIVGFGSHGGHSEAWLARIPTSCYANCDGSSTPPVLTIADFVCFQNRFAAGDPGANCDGSTLPPLLSVNDFICFQTRFAAGCP